MAEKKTENSQYKSPNSGEFCTPEQYIAEILMTRKYDKDKKQLPFKFWNIDIYKKEFIQYILWANKLTKVYPHEIVIKVLHTTGNWIAFLYTKKLNDLIEQELTKVEKQSEEFNLEVVSTETKPTVKHGKKSTLGKLLE